MLNIKRRLCFVIFLVILGSGLLASEGSTEPPQIKITLDKSSINKLLSHFQGTTFSNTWKEMPFRPTLFLKIHSAQVTNFFPKDRQIGLDIKGRAKLEYFILGSQNNSAIEFVAKVRSSPRYTKDETFLQILHVDITFPNQELSEQIDILPIEELIQTILLPEFIPLFSFNDLQKLSIPLPGKAPVILIPKNKKIRLGKERLIVIISLQIQPA